MAHIIPLNTVFVEVDDVRHDAGERIGVAGIVLARRLQLGCLVEDSSNPGELHRRTTPEIAPQRFSGTDVTGWTEGLWPVESIMSIEWKSSPYHCSAALVISLPHCVFHIRRINVGEDLLTIEALAGG